MVSPLEARHGCERVAISWVIFLASPISVPLRHRCGVPRGRGDAVPVEGRKDRGGTPLLSAEHLLGWYMAEVRDLGLLALPLVDRVRPPQQRPSLQPLGGAGWQWRLAVGGIDGVLGVDVWRCLV